MLKLPLRSDRPLGQPRGVLLQPAGGAPLRKPKHHRHPHRQVAAVHQHVDHAEPRRQRAAVEKQLAEVVEDFVQTWMKPDENGLVAKGAK